MADDTSTPATAPTQIGILRASEVSLPVFNPGTNAGSGELAKLRADFLSGKEMATADMRRLMVHSTEGGGSNGNCGIC